ncbi:ubiquitin-like small modifier protein 1 [Halorussus caseinilyticus]|uniref:Ubiquitin-like small modifier protein 1 n=1 Tax=Halorussus caseinilyticus TaxID=3034025 RepID=A0ABD5WIP3_9EURY|nr:ubiquitin-like small modifier protein 1 [Halorussus sp. DT72]
MTTPSETLTVELTFYATFREAVGRKSLTRELPASATLGDALADAAEEYPDLDGEILDESGELRHGVRALKNGRESADADTRLEDGDEVSFVTPIHGG